MTDDVISGLVAGALLLLPAVVFTVFFETPVTEFLARITGGRFGGRGRKRLGNHWVARWNRLDVEQPEWKYEHLLVRQFRDKAFARLVTGDRRLTGRLVGLHLTGEWWDATDPGGRYGAIQLVVQERATKMEGRWVGFSEHRDYVRHGAWEMVCVFDPQARYLDAKQAWERATK